MARIIVVGGGLIGLATALMIARRDGHEVTVLEHDPAPAPDSPGDAWESWGRDGVTQFRLVHYLHPRGRHLLDEHLPEVTQALIDADAAQFSPITIMPPGITDRAPRPGDERFTTVTARRPVLEYAMAGVADGAIDVRRGVHVAGLLSDGQRHVTGVRTGDGAELRADLVIDAMGRRSPLPAWLAAIGAGTPAEETSDPTFTYYGRFFRATGHEEPPSLRSAIATRFDSYVLLTVPGDARTWSVTVFISSRDQAFKALREEANWTRLVSACPLQAHLLNGEPITGVLAMAGLSERLRGLVTDGTPAATGILTVGDSWATTNPAFGRGITIGLMHAALTAEVVSEHLADPLALALAHDRVTRDRVLPWYQETAQLDRQLSGQLAAVAEGRPPAPPPSRAPGPAALMRDLTVGMLRDADLFRAYTEITAMLAPTREVLSRPGLAERIAEVAAGQTMPLPPGPSRAEVLAMLS